MPMVGGLKNFKHELLLLLLGLASLPVAIGYARAQSWTLTSATNANWKQVLTSADGTILTAIQGENPIGSAGSILMSTNSGGTWAVLENAPSTGWESIACSASGTYFLGAYTDKLYTMSIYPTPTWQERVILIAGTLIYSVAASADGTRMAVGTGYTQIEPFPLTFGDVVFSTNSGLTWATNNLPQAVCSSVACSGNGSVFAAAQSGGRIYVSTNSGSTWQTNNWPVEKWAAVALSTNGNLLAAAASNGLIYVTTDLGITWQTNDAPSAFWRSIAMSADGSRMIAVGNEFIYTSTNSGVNWVSNNAPSQAWSSAASSADGSKLIAASQTGGGGGIYTWQAVPSLNLMVTDGGCLLSWPCLSSTTNYALQQNGDLTTTNWAAVTNQPGVTNGQYQVMLPPQSGSQFYRLLQGQ